MNPKPETRQGLTIQAYIRRQCQGLSITGLVERFLLICQCMHGWAGFVRCSKSVLTMCGADKQAHEMTAHVVIGGDSM